MLMVVTVQAEQIQPLPPNFSPYTFATTHLPLS